MMSFDIARAAVRSVCPRACRGATVLLAGAMMLAGPANAGQSLESLLWKGAAATTLALAAATNPLGADGVTAEVGGGNRIAVVGIGARWDWNEDLLDVFGWKVDSYWKLEFFRWQSLRNREQSGTSLTAGLVPVFRFVDKDSRFRPYVDVGVGIAVFSASRFEGRQFGSNFQFTDVFGFGGHFGQHNQWKLGYKFQHYSNGSVKIPNKGINFHFLSLSYLY